MKASTQTLNLAYTDRSITRAERALCCAPFQLTLFTAMKVKSVPLPYIAGEKGREEDYTLKSLSEQRVERELMWLIQVGLLRREVDGQGITDSFRLTPLGRQIVDKWNNQTGYLPQPSWWERVVNRLIRWFSLPF